MGKSFSLVCDLRGIGFVQDLGAAAAYAHLHQLFSQVCIYKDALECWSCGVDNVFCAAPDACKSVACTCFVQLCSAWLMVNICCSTDRWLLQLSFAHCTHMALVSSVEVIMNCLQ